MSITTLVEKRYKLEDSEVEEEEEEEEEENYKGRTQCNSPSYTTAKCLLDRDKRTANWKASPHPPLPLAEVGRKRK